MLTLAQRLITSVVRPMSTSAYKTLTVNEPSKYVVHVELNRPEQYNAFNKEMFSDLTKCFNDLSDNADCRSIVLSGSGKHFTAGLDLRDNHFVEPTDTEDVARKGAALGKVIRQYQEAISSLESCAKPVITVVHSACVGAGVDLITAADIRYCTKDAWFQVKEIHIGMAADVGTLQRLPKVVGNHSAVRELCYTGRKFDSAEADKLGLVSRVYGTRDNAITDAIKLATDLAELSPIAMQATKQTLIYSIDHTTQQGLDKQYEMNKLLLQSEDFVKACMGQITKEVPVFAKL